VAAGTLVLAACSGGNAAPAASGSAGASSTGGEKITLTVATFNEFGYDNLFAEYEALNPGITVEHRKAATTQEARDNMYTRLAAGGSGLADVEAIEIDWMAELQQYADKFEEVGDEVEKGRWLDWKAAQATTADGKLIAYGTDIGPEAICYRSDLFQAAGLPTDEAEVAKLLGNTWESYFDAGRAFKKVSKVPWFDGAQGTFTGMVNQIQNAYEKPDGTPIPLADNKQIKDLFDQVMHVSVDEGLSAGLTQWTDDWANAFQTNGFATMLCPAWMLGVISGNAAGVDGWRIADTFPGGGGNWGGAFLTVPSAGKHIEEAKKLAAWLTAPEQAIKAFEAKGPFPSQVEALGDQKLLGQTNAFFGGAPTGKIFANRAAAVKVVPFKGKSYFGINQAVVDAIARVDTDKTDDAASSWEKAIQAVDELGLG
jgi:cellobiose transport system substrate-binding protein